MLLVFKEEPMAEEKNTVGQGDGSQDYQMNRKMGTIFILNLQIKRNVSEQ